MLTRHLPYRPFSRWPTPVHAVLVVTVLLLTWFVGHMLVTKAQKQLTADKQNLEALQLKVQQLRAVALQVPTTAAPDFTQSLPNRSVADDVVRDMGRNATSIGVSLPWCTKTPVRVSWAKCSSRCLPMPSMVVPKHGWPSYWPATIAWLCKVCRCAPVRARVVAKNGSSFSPCTFRAKMQVRGRQWVWFSLAALGLTWLLVPSKNTTPPAPAMGALSGTQLASVNTPAKAELAAVSLPQQLV